MNYDNIYDNLMTRAIARQLYCPLIGYVEKHHILPKCLFPEFADLRKYPNNCAVLTPEEHYLAHLLLVKMIRYKNHKKYNGLIFGAHMMSTSSKLHNGNRNNKSYAWVRVKVANEVSKIMTGRPSSRKNKSYEEIHGIKQAKKLRKKLRKSSARRGSRTMTGRKHNPTTIIKQKHAQKEVGSRPDVRSKRSAARKGKTYKEIWGTKLADKIKQQHRISMTGRKDNKKIRRKKSVSAKKRGLSASFISARSNRKGKPAHNRGEKLLPSSIIKRTKSRKRNLLIKNLKQR